MSVETRDLLLLTTVALLLKKAQIKLQQQLNQKRQLRKKKCVRKRNGRQRNVLNNLPSGVDTESLDESTLFYYNHMKFLNDIEVDRGSRSSSSMSDDLNDLDSFEPPTSADRKPDPAALLASTDPPRSTHPITQATVQRWDQRLETMTKEQRLLSEKFINEILFEGQMGTLHRQSMTLNVTQTLSSTSDSSRGSSPLI